MTQHTTRVDGIDVAKYQRDVDWPVVKANIAGPGFAAWKVSQGTSSLDPYREKNREGTRAAGFRWRFGYHWLSPKIDPVLQADWFLAHYTPKEAGEGVLLDAEETGITAAQTLAWCEHVEQVTQRPVAVYTGVYVSQGTIWNSTQIYNGQRIRFLAAYTSEMKVRKLAEPYGFDAWQGDGGATGTFPGVDYPVDLDMVEHPIMFDLACSISAAPPDPPPDPIPLPTEDAMPMLFKKDTKAAVWLADGKSRSHVAAGKDTALISLYGPIVLLSANANLATIGTAIVGDDPGDV